MSYFKSSGFFCLFFVFIFLVFKYYIFHIYQQQSDYHDPYLFLSCRCLFGLSAFMRQEHCADIKAS